MVTHDLVTALGGWRRVSPTARMSSLKRGGGIPVDRMSPCDALFERRFRRMIVSVVRKWPCQSTRDAGRVISVALRFIGAESVTFRGGTLTRAFPGVLFCAPHPILGHFLQDFPVALRLGNLCETAAFLRKSLVFR